MNATHPGPSVDDLLDGIAEAIDDLGSRVVDAIHEATRVLLESDLDGARRVIEGDDELDALTLDIEDRCLQVLILHGPRAKDLRSVIAALRMASEIERCGDLASNIAKAARRLYHVDLDPRLRGMVDRMSQLAERLLHAAIVSYREGDEAWAAALDDLDDELDDLHRAFVEAIFTTLRDDTGLRTGVQLALVGRFYERLGDHAVNIGERVRYQLTGWTPEHAGAVRHDAANSVDPGTVADIAEAFDRRHHGFASSIDAQAERRRVSELRRDFVANISHELRTPLGAVAVLAETLRDEAADLAGDRAATVRRLSERIVGETDRLTATVEDLLELSRIESGDQLATHAVAVADVVDEAVGRSAGAADLAGVTLDVAPIDRQATLTGDRRQLVSALVNLIANAVQYSDPGQQVDVAARADGDDWIFTVADHGIGIPRADQDRIFERFYRVDPARRRDTGGTGLGLAIVRHVAINHDGEITVASTEGEGSTFAMRIPAEVTARTSADATEAAEAQR